ncbi:MAG TPA: AAA family ATPase [Candidatus Binatia bacterium]|nr:AAA family ATPase [Candidatus Binatia bacterium]
MSGSTSKNLYEEHFGLLEFPFGITPNPRFSYNHSSYREAFATLRYGIEARKGFIVITGEVGTGKTTLLRTFIRSVESTVSPAFIFNPKLTFSQFIRSILTELGVVCSSHDRFTLIEKLNDYLIEKFQKNHIVAILVDEAQDLSDEMLEELRLLSNLENDRSGLIQIVLTGQPEFERRLDQPELRQLKQRIALRCQLTPLPSGEVGPYINHRLRKAGYQGEELFEAKAVERICLTSHGIPRLINVLCDNALLMAYASSRKTVSAEMIEETARDLELTAPPGIQRPSFVVEEFHTPRVQNAVRRDQMQGTEPGVDPVSEEFFMEGRPSELYRKHKTKRVRLKTFLVLFLITSIGAVIYTPQNTDFVSNIATRVEVVSEQSRHYVSNLAVEVEQQGRESLSDAARKAENYFSAFTARMKSDSPRGTNHLSDLAVAMSAQFEKISLSISTIIVKMEDYLHESRDYLLRIPAKIRGSLQQGPRPASKPADAKETTGTIRDQLEGQPVDSRTDPPETERLQLDRKTTSKRETPSLLGNFEVIQDSFLRDKPGSATTITILPPGTRIRVERRDGDYFRVHSLDEPELRGYVHREDAFFERIR